MVVVTALIAFTVLGMGSRAAERGRTLSTRALDTAEASRAEREFRDLLGGIVPANRGDAEASFVGRAELLIVRTGLATSVRCADEGVHVVRLRVKAGSLVCEVAGRERLLLRWRDGVGRFSYSVDGRHWTTAWQAAPATSRAATGSTVAALVRFELQVAQAPGVVWVARAGAVEPELARAVDGGAR